MKIFLIILFIGAIVNANTIIKYYVAEHIISKKFKSIGIYILIMKTNSESQLVIKRIKYKSIEFVEFDNY
ncbi:hypothetical protein QTG87_09865 [Clostridium perfringens]|nr:hypothetical protein [Clostridium perfringens]